MGCSLLHNHRPPSIRRELSLDNLFASLHRLEFCLQSPHESPAILPNPSQAFDPSIESPLVEDFSTSAVTKSQEARSSNSDENPQVLNDRKQRRMLSNRESARRSRLRKQQHLDELRAHVGQLRAENRQMLSSFSIASQRYAQLTEENRILRSEATELSHRLKQLHHTLAMRCSQSSKAFQYGLDPGQILGLLSSEPSHLPSLS